MKITTQLIADDWNNEIIFFSIKLNSENPYIYLLKTFPERYKRWEEFPQTIQNNLSIKKIDQIVNKINRLIRKKEYVGKDSELKVDLYKIDEKSKEVVNENIKIIDNLIRNI